MNIPSSITSAEIVGHTVAVLIDGENISQTHGKTILERAGHQGVPRIRRVYGNAKQLSDWDAMPGVDLIHTGSGKNSADMKLAIDAVDMALRQMAETFVIASSDSDFTHLARFLRERGFGVTGMGTVQTKEEFQRECQRFIFLKSESKPEPLEMPKPAKSPLEKKVCQVITDKGENRSLKIQTLGTLMNSEHEVKLKNLPEKNWRSFLDARPNLFKCEAKGANAVVRLKPGV